LEDSIAFVCFGRFFDNDTIGKAFMANTTVVSPVRILIVDDHPNTAIMLARVLSRFESPVEVLTSANSEEALRQIGDCVVDILITDFMMPGMNGLELIEKLKGERKPAHTILITAYDTPGLAISARRLGVQDYLVKPVQPEKIREIVSKVIHELRAVPTETPAAPVNHRSFKILIADDYPDNVRLLATRLQSEGYEFISACDGEETLAKLRSEAPDLLLLDVNMPKKDGFQVLAEMRGEPNIAHIPVIVISAARIGPKDVREGLTLGADDYVIKPFDWRELAARIKSKLRVKQAEDILRRRTKELGMLPEIGQELSARLDIEEVADIVASRTAQTLGAASARLDVLLPDGRVCGRLFKACDVHSEVLRISRDQSREWGLTDFILTERQGVVIENVHLDPRWHSPNGDGTTSAVAVPLLGRKDVIGVLTLTHPETAYFTTEHQGLLQAIASQAAIAIENAQLFDVEHRRVKEMAALNRIMQAILRFTHSRELLEQTPRLIQEELGYPAAAVWNGIANSTENLTLQNMVGNERGWDTDLLVGAPQKAVSGCQTVLISDPNVTPSVVAVPLVVEGTPRGALSVYSPAANTFQERDCALLETLATQVVSALERVGLFESVEKEQRRLMAVLQSAADAILVIDSSLRLTLANPAGESLFSDTDSRVGQSLPMGQGYDGLIELLKLTQASGVHQQGEVDWPDGSVFSVSVTPIEEGGQVVVLHDISRFKALAELKNEYIATASHDLKNPIMAVMGYNDLLAAAGPLNPMQQEFTKRINHSAAQMRDLVLNLLEVSRLESGMPMKLEVLDLHDLLSKTVQELEDRAQVKGQVIELDFCPMQLLVRGDRTLLLQMMHNLLSNAIKYTPQEGKITLTTLADGQKLSIQFRDTGFGIPSEDLPNIFNKFFRVRNDTTKDIEGTGLGLSIVKSIVENHAGLIDVQSVVGEGSIFTVRLPIYHPT
jgi:signal transduction histidine kinase/DNA-binding response OmpR family regulator